MKAIDELTTQLMRQRHAHHLEQAMSQLILCWKAHYEAVPDQVEARQEVVLSMGTLGSGKTPRDPQRIAALPSILLDPTELEALSTEIEAIHAEFNRPKSGQDSKG